MKGVEKRSRFWFKAFEEPPHRLLFVAEVVSPTTVKVDTHPKKKPAKYAALGFEEYFLMDPIGDLLSAPVQGFRLVNGVYAPIPPLPTGAVRSETLGLEFLPSSGLLRVVDPRTGWEYLPGDEAQTRVETESRRAESEYRRAEEQRRRAEDERRRAEEERHRANREAEENARLRTEIEALRRQLKPE